MVVVGVVKVAGGGCGQSFQKTTSHDVMTTTTFAKSLRVCFPFLSLFSSLVCCVCGVHVCVVVCVCVCVWWWCVCCVRRGVRVFLNKGLALQSSIKLSLAIDLPVV